MKCWTVVPYLIANDRDDEKKGDDEDEDLEEQLIKAQRDRIMGVRTESAMYFMSSDDEDEEDTEGVAAQAGGKGTSL